MKNPMQHMPHGILFMLKGYAKRSVVCLLL